ncbi:MAG: hypothetical protein JSV61_05020 [Anaerolineales bacterium]|nr:MAG: hypothetical protein JSV61_05020 [Anaerolineales bacterium]
MKKKYVRFGAILTLMAVLLVGIVPAMAAEKTVFSCVDGGTELLNPGVWTFPDGNVHVRGMVLRTRNNASDPRDQGYNTIVMNANWGKDGAGPMWGTFSLETDEGGLWKGTWAGRDTEQGSWYNAVGDGYGLYAGMKIWVDKNYDVCQVSILEH